MRTIKFRAWDNRKKYFVTDYDDESVRLDMKTGELIKQDYIELQQFTGLSDRKKKEIYEGDIVKYTDKFNLTSDIENGVVSFEDGSYGIDDGGFVSFDLFLSSPGCDGMKTMKVVGNIYENPELL